MYSLYIWSVLVGAVGLSTYCDGSPLPQVVYTNSLVPQERFLPLDPETEHFDRHIPIKTTSNKINSPRYRRDVYMGGYYPLPEDSPEHESEGEEKEIEEGKEMEEGKKEEKQGMKEEKYEEEEEEKPKEKSGENVKREKKKEKKGKKEKDEEGKEEEKEEEEEEEHEEHEEEEEHEDDDDDSEAEESDQSFVVVPYDSNSEQDNSYEQHDFERYSKESGMDMKTSAEMPVTPR